MEYVLKTESIKKRYGNHDVLKGLSMNVPKGSIYGFIGKNGAMPQNYLNALLDTLNYPA